MSTARILGIRRPPRYTEKTAMHAAIGYQLAQRDTLARAARGVGRRCRPGLRPWGPHRTRDVPGTAQAAQPAVAADAPAR